MGHTPLLEELPEISQSDKFRSKISYEYSDTKDVYEITKGPAIRVFDVTSNGRTFVEGVDYDLIENADGNITKIDWGIGGDSPDDQSLFFVDQEFRAVIARYLESHDEEFDSLQRDFVQIISARQVAKAKGDDLDRIGAIFGELGRRGNRNDSEYRAFLTSIVDSFSGRGSRAGLKFAIAAAVGSSPDNIIIDENVEELEYSVTIDDVGTEFISVAINDLAELADPSGVELDEAIIIIQGNDIIVDSDGASVTSDSSGLGSGTLTLDGNSTLG